MHLFFFSLFSSRLSSSTTSMLGGRLVLDPAVTCDSNRTAILGIVCVVGLIPCSLIVAVVILRKDLSTSPKTIVCVGTLTGKWLD